MQKESPLKTTVKVVSVVVFVSLALGGLIGGSWWLEDYSKRINTVVVEQPGGHLFIVEVEEKEGGTVFIQCDEDEFEDAFKQFRRFLNVKEPPLAVPGGPMVIAHAPAEVSKKLQPAQRALIEVLKRHSPRRIILLAHSDCLLYDTVAAWQNELNDVKRRQFEDLRRAVEALRKWFPKSEVQVYYALKDGKKLIFNPADLEHIAGPPEQRLILTQPQQSDTPSDHSEGR